VGRSASLFGLLGLIFLGFGFVGIVLLAQPLHWYTLLNLVAGLGLLVAYLAFGLDNLRTLVGRRSTKYGAGAAVYTFLFLALVVGINYLGARRHTRWDVTETGVYTLAPQSKKVIESLPEPLVVTAFTEGGINPAIESLLDSFRYVAPEKVSFKIVDPDKEPALVEQMKITAVPSINLQVGKESFVVSQPSEETITNGILRVARTTKKVVYFTQGFGEAGIDDKEKRDGYAGAKVALEQENYEVKTLVLGTAEKLPDDASAVIIAGLERPIADQAVDALDAYLKRGGHLLLLLGPRQGSEKLVKLLEDWGVKIGNDVVLDQEMRIFEGPRVGMSPLVRSYGVHPITEGFRDATTYLRTRTVEPAADGKKGLSATGLVKTGETAWAETNLESLFGQGTASLDDTDRKGPVTLAVAVEAKLKDMGITPPPAEDARLVVFGTPTFANNQQLVQFPQNGDLFQNAVGWLVGQAELVSIRSRSVRASRAELSDDQAGTIFLLSVLILPQLLTILGIITSWRRRSA
jgi:ABC-type uncharacterized transport system involved in gliding motility auxiliary subunit